MQESQAQPLLRAGVDLLRPGELLCAGHVLPSHCSMLQLGMRDWMRDRMRHD